MRIQIHLIFWLGLLLNVSAFAETNAEIIWVDVRSAFVHRLDRIEGDVHIPHDEIVGKLSKLNVNKDSEIRLYCQGGGRAAQAVIALDRAGYLNVSNAGGIDDARRERGMPR